MPFCSTLSNHRALVFITVIELLQRKENSHCSDCQEYCYCFQVEKIHEFFSTNAIRKFLRNFNCKHKWSHFKLWKFSLHIDSLCTWTATPSKCQGRRSFSSSKWHSSTCWNMWQLNISECQLILTFNRTAVVMPLIKELVKAVIGFHNKKCMATNCIWSWSWFQQNCRGFWPTKISKNS